MKHTVTVLGAGSMGTATAQVLADNGNIVNIWNWEGDHTPLKQIEKYRENKKYLKNIKLSKNIKSKYNIGEALHDSEVVFFAIPSSVLEHTVSFGARSIENNAILVDLSKGLDPKNLRIMTDVIAKHVRPKLRKNIVSISGPAVVGQMVKKEYTAMNIASKNKKAIKKVRDIFENKYLKLIPTSDVIGVEVGGSFKNVYAIAFGFCDAMNYGMNTKAALVTMSIKEIADLSKAMGGKRETVYGLAGLGDLLGTAFCEDSRNRKFGECLGKGMSRASACKKVRQTIEGIEAAKSLIALKKKYKLHMPFADVVYAAIHGKRDPRRVMKHFLDFTTK
jgi:glycerol-3-phosphate dehydrogenase (NAD(P)+)